MSNAFKSTMIDADNDTLMRQAPMTTDTYLAEALVDIDKRLGKGYAKAHPELIAAFMQAAASDLGAAVIARAIQDGMHGIEGAIREGLQSDTLRTDHPLMGETLDGITGALQEIAAALTPDQNTGLRGIVRGCQEWLEQEPEQE